MVAQCHRQDTAFFAAVPGFIPCPRSMQCPGCSASPSVPGGLNTTEPSTPALPWAPGKQGKVGWGRGSKWETSTFPPIVLGGGHQSPVTPSQCHLPVSWSWEDGQTDGRRGFPSPFPDDDDDGSQEDNEDDEPAGTDPQDQPHLLRVLRHLQRPLALFAGSCQGKSRGRRSVLSSLLAPARAGHRPLPPTWPGRGRKFTESPQLEVTHEDHCIQLLHNIYVMAT